MPRVRRRVLVIAGVLAAVGALAFAGITAAATSLSLKASSTQLKFNKKTLRASHGKVTIVMSNPSSTKHGIAIEGHGVDKDGKIVGKGKTSRVTVTLKKGRYTFYCPVSGHRAAGMKGTLIVS
jgi:plastocyanin